MKKSAETVKPDIVLTGNGEHRISPQVWASLCRKYNVPVDFEPKYLSNGAEQTVYEFGPNYVLKLSDRDFIIESATKLRGHNIPHVARCFSVMKAHKDPKNKFYCIVQELCKPGNDGYNFMASLAMILSNANSVDALQAVLKLKRLGIKSIVDFQNANAMKNINDKTVVSDYGCLRF